MKLAVVSGSSSGIGEAIATRLLDLNYRVLGLSRTCSIEHKNYEHIFIDLSDEKASLEFCKKIQKEEVFILINSAGFGKFEPHEELNAKTITQMTFLNLTIPMLLTNAMLRNLKKNNGYLININSIEALYPSKFSGVYSATKAGLKAFGESLFEETRKSGLSITNINPDMTESNFYNHLRFETSKKEDERLLCTDIADSVEHILTMRKGAVVSEYTIRSLNFGISKKSIKK